MKNSGLLLAGMGVGLLLGAFISKVFDLEWLAVSLGVVALVWGGVSMPAQKNKR